MTRATSFESTADAVHYPGTYRAGCYNRLTSIVQGQAVDDEAIVNLPNWLLLTFRIDDGAWCSLDDVELLSYRQALDLRQGLLQRRIVFCDRQGRRTSLREQRLASMADSHLIGVMLELTADNWSGELEVRTAIDGWVRNSNVPRYKPFQNDHLEPLSAGALAPEGIRLTMRTLQSHLEVAVAARTRVSVRGRLVDAEPAIDQEAAFVAQRYCCPVTSGSTVTVEKIAALFTSRDPVIDECSIAARDAIRHAPQWAMPLDILSRLRRP